MIEQAKSNYKKIIAKVPEFEARDRFKMNLVNCAMLSAFLLAMEEKTTVEKLTAYYEASMMTPLMRFALRARRH